MEGEVSDDDTPGRCKVTGRFLKGYSGRGFAKQVEKRPREPMLPHELAAALLEAASQPIDVKDRNGRTRRLPAHEVVTHQLAAAAARGDKSAMRLFTNALTQAAKTVQTHAQDQSDQLGAYLRSVDEGAPWRLDATEAAFYQGLADQAGLEITITPYDPHARPEPVSAQEIDATMADAEVQILLRKVSQSLRRDEQRALVRCVLRADRARRTHGPALKRGGS